jgi:anti-sigma B factor antagonist
MHWTEIVERRIEDVVIFDLHGQMTLSGEETPRLLQQIRRVVSDGCRKVLLNLTHVSYVDSTGIGEIVGAYTRVVREGGRLSLFGASTRIQELLDTTNIGTIIASFPDEATALLAVGPGRLFH